jgi:catechol 2,3-dioxygenase-like lactoylglutathione lyase family enzyme
MTLNHVHLGSKNVKHSTEFYNSVFGFQKKFDHGEGIFIENSEGFLIAIDPVSEIPVLPAWFHLGFCLRSESEALSMYEKCSDLGVKFARQLMHVEDEYVSFFILDPDGYKLEVSWHKD